VFGAPLTRYPCGDDRARLSRRESSRYRGALPGRLPVRRVSEGATGPDAAIPGSPAWGPSRRPGSSGPGAGRGVGRPAGTPSGRNPSRRGRGARGRTRNLARPGGHRLRPVRFLGGSPASRGQRGPEPSAPISGEAFPRFTRDGAPGLRAPGSARSGMAGSRPPVRIVRGDSPDRPGGLGALGSVEAGGTRPPANGGAETGCRCEAVPGGERRLSSASTGGGGDGPSERHR
jgi:hypothetical protein